MARAIAALLILSGTLAAGWALAPPSDPIHAISPARVDFGVVELGVDPVAVRHTLRYRNRGWRSVGLTGTAATCGCTAVTAGGSVVAPGDELAIEVVMTLADPAHRDSAVRVAFDNGQLFVHEFHAIGARALGARLLSGEPWTTRRDVHGHDGDVEWQPDGKEASDGRLWLLATTGSDVPPPSPVAIDGGVVQASEPWEPVGGGSARKPHHWMTSVTVAFDPASDATDGRGRLAPLVLQVGSQPVRVERRDVRGR